MNARLTIFLLLLINIRQRPLILAVAPLSVQNQIGKVEFKTEYSRKEEKREENKATIVLSRSSKSLTTHSLLSCS